MKTTIDIPEPLLKKAKIRAIKLGQSLKQVVLTALERELETPEKVAETPVSYRANRKLLPKFAKLQAEGAFKPEPGTPTIEEILNEVKADTSL